MQLKQKIVTLGLVLAVFATAALARDLYMDPAEDEKYFGEVDNILFWTPEQQVAGYRNMEKISPARRVPASSDPLPLPKAERDLDGLSISGEFEGAPFSFTLGEYFHQQRMAGLLVIREGAIAYERYGLGNTQDSRWVSFSVTKSVVSMLIGAAVRDGYIESVDEPITGYLPRLKGSVYDETTIRNLLQMASGVTWNEDYSDPESDVNRAEWETLSLYRTLAGKPRAGAAGEAFNYNTAETNLAGNLLRAAIGNNLSTYLNDKIWQPFGMEADAWWPLTEPNGGEFGGCCLAATLRDYGRIGLFALNGGALADGTQVLPEDWMAESTTPSEAAPYYGYFWWLTENGAYAASGIFGQGIYIDPNHDLVIAMQSAREKATDPRDRHLQRAMIAAVTRALTSEDGP
jgi:CubicO group peptidase (beta-lactamase class C family)